MEYAVTGGNIYFDTETGTVTGCDRSVTEAVIPAEIGGVSVTGIGSCAFRECTSLINITIPDSITTIGSSAFSGCTSLPSIAIPNGVTMIKHDTFYNCSKLAVVSLPVSITCIEEWAFGYCASLASITIPYGVTTIEYDAFRNCYRLTSIIIPESVSDIGVLAFSGCSSLASAIIPDSVTSIGSSAFSSCNSLSTIYYSGTASDWEKIEIGIKNDPLERATIYFNSEFYSRMDGETGEILQVVYAENGMHIHGSISADSPVYIAIYDADGKMLSVRYLDSGKDILILPGVKAKVIWVTSGFVPKSEAISIPLNYSLFDPSSAPIFSDVPTSASFYWQVEYVAALGILAGYEDGSFRPNGNMTIAEYLTILYRYAYKKIPSTMGAQVSTTGANWMEGANWMNIYLLGGAYTDLTAPLTRYNMADINYVVLQVIARINGTALNTRTTHGFTDVLESDVYFSILEYLESIYVIDRDLFDENTYTFKGEQNLKRSEAAVILYNIYSLPGEDFSVIELVYRGPRGEMPPPGGPEALGGEAPSDAPEEEASPEILLEEAAPEAPPEEDTVAQSPS